MNAFAKQKNLTESRMACANSWSKPNPEKVIQTFEKVRSRTKSKVSTLNLIIRGFRIGSENIFALPRLGNGISHGDGDSGLLRMASCFWSKHVIRILELGLANSLTRKIGIKGKTVFLLSQLTHFVDRMQSINLRVSFVHFADPTKLNWSWGSCSANLEQNR